MNIIRTPFDLAFDFVTTFLGDAGARFESILLKPEAALLAPESSQVAICHHLPLLAHLVPHLT